MEDQSILKLILKPSTRLEGFNLLVETYQERLYWHIRKMVLNHDDADDVLQNTFIKVWKALENFRGDSKIYTWIYRIATNESLSHIQKSKRTFSGDPNFDTALSTQIESDPFFDGDEAVLKLWKAIELLPAKQKTVFKLKYFEEMKYEEMSELLDTSVGSLKASYHHAVGKVKEVLQKQLNY